MSMTTLAALTGAVFLTFTPIYEEDEVPDYTLPDPLVTEAGETVDSPQMWREVRRPETFALFQEHVYGEWLPDPGHMRFEVVDDEPGALDGAATRRQVIIHFTEGDDRPSMELLLYLPNDVEGPVPMFLYLSFWGNQAIHEDPEIRLSRRWMRGHGEGVEDNRATEASRGTSPQPVETILERGYGLATFYYGDIALDNADRYREDVLSLFQNTDEERGPTDAGAIGAWAWGLSRALDYLETDEDADAARTAVVGHSRLGKTALWAGAGDERFAITISNNSGCGGAALSRRRFGERVSRINDSFPHWFCHTFREYNEREDALPVDQHQLIALMAPRPVYVASATEDEWADPRGEFLAAYHAGPVFELFGESPLPVDEMPAPSQPAHGTAGYHIREGGHSITPEDWAHYLDFADQHYGR
ncbi:MAG: acetylxylan esterase [Candidatus Hydrogenedentota bacterium]